MGKKKIEEIKDNELYTIQIRGLAFKALKSICNKRGNKQLQYDVASKIIAEYGTLEIGVNEDIEKKILPDIKRRMISFNLPIPKARKDKDKKKQKALKILEEIYKKTNFHIEVYEETFINKISIRTQLQFSAKILGSGIGWNYWYDIYEDKYFDNLKQLILNNKNDLLLKVFMEDKFINSSDINRLCKDF
jgi:hypothetical protein